uniref:Amine oxidase domain-containing protein n=1 Tax=Panagrolaimus davidi TaxID=227884 RepID=A0A914P630_9BILA
MKSTYQIFSQSIINLNFIIILLSCTSSQSIKARQQQQPKVAIIGAGFAGLSAADRFMENGFQNFEIFEAENRIGGRVFPVKYKDGYLQMGAQYIDGNKNPLYDLAENLGVIDHSMEDIEHLDVSTIRYGNCPIQKQVSLKI